MKGSECKLVEYMDGSKKRFVIPVYQRNYDWKTEHCKQLYDDLVKVIRNDRSSHFFGSIVSVYNPDGKHTEFRVIDGQQRLTTVSLLLLAMHNLMERGIVSSADASLSQQIFEDYLIDKWKPEETRIKLKPVKDDQLAFSKLFEDEKEHIPESNLTVNYHYFYDRIQEREITVDALHDAICSLEIINITLNAEDNAQLIFESLNSTGLALSEGDKIRNFILMGLPTKEQNTYYDKYWNRIERCTGYDVSSFIRDYLSVKQQAIPSQSKVYLTFKTFVEEEKPGTEALLQEMLAYAQWYQVLLRGQTDDRQLNACIYRLNRLETTVTRPFFLEVLRLHAEGRLALAEVSDVFLTTERYLFRRTMCDLPTNALNKIFLLLHKEVMRFDGTDADYVAKFKYALLSKKERARFPDDGEFADAFASRPVYLMNSKNKIYILERLENHGTIEDKDIYRHVDDGDYTIEHIMPQHLTPAWAKALGADYEQIHELWLHRIANLTLTAYNPKYGNNTFEDKRTREDGFLDSGIRLNAYIARRTQWTLAELEARSDHLVKRALDIWAFPVTAYQPKEKQMDAYTLEDDVNLSGRSIARFRFKNAEQPVTSWIDMYERVLRMLHAEDQTVLSKLAYATDPEMELAGYVSNRKEALRDCLELEQGLYLEKNTSTWLKLSLLRRFFKLFRQEPADLVFYLRDGEETVEEAIAGTRYALRKRYWAYALPIIQEAHGEEGAFCYVNPTKENWISGFFGVGGCCINCVANFDQSRVEFQLGRGREENKAMFAFLLAQRAEIEAALGVPLVWYAGEHIKASSVRYALEHVSISNDADWPQMAQFHAAWSKRFYDELVPRLKQYPAG